MAEGERSAAVTTFPEELCWFGNVGPLHVYDAFGREVRAPLIGQQLDVSTWAAGVYVVSDGKSASRFLVVR